ncbi:MAG: hypothetical protein UT48_C0026G0008 [Parcubacteria group bacterium GW2011_GWE2_39_37]|nr:MAG: hypothetical protein UT48_C0026G0008 [Parcubacteria group bacterium GW2011_GWE2_39_37]
MPINIKRYLGIDYGTKRIGLALGDSEMKIAMPFMVVADVDAVIKAIEDEDIDEIVIGLPITMKNEAGAMKKDVDQFIEKLKEKTSLPIIEIDERLTSKGADALVGNKKTKAERDAIAAMIILQSYLDKI